MNASNALPGLADPARSISDSRMYALIFDFDGTLIDSSSGILSCYNRTLARHGIKPSVALDRSLIGPPLAATLAYITGLSAAEDLQAMIDTFKAEYDSGGYLATEAYPGVAETLQQLAAAGLKLFLATNKRIAPTRKIIAHFGWEKHFTAVYALDAIVPAAANKAALVGEIVRREAIDVRHAAVVGDSPEDAHAAREHGLPFFAALWGYGGLAQAAPDPSWRRLDHIAGLLDHTGSRD